MSDKKLQAHLEAYTSADDLYSARKFARALVGFRRALSLAPGDSDTLWAVADCYSDLKRPRMAERYYRAALKKATRGDRSALLFNVGNALFDQGCFADAVRCYRRVPSKASRNNLALAQERLLDKRSQKKPPARRVKR